MVTLDVKEILNSRGLDLSESGTLSLPNGEVLTDVEVKMDQRNRLDFTLTVASLTHEDLIVMTYLSEIFGRNRAQYTIIRNDRSTRASKTSASHIKIIFKEAK